MPILYPGDGIIFRKAWNLIVTPTLGIGYFYVVFSATLVAEHDLLFKNYQRPPTLSQIFLTGFSLLSGLFYVPCSMLDGWKRLMRDPYWSSPLRC